MEVEKELAVVIPDAEAEKMKTVGEIIDYVEAAKAKQGAGKPPEPKAGSPS